ncbi:MAG: acetolactate decarboxylase [Methanoregulaceae archaeon]|jgi:acetolactate decarboxylase|nr:acetolactate decarboxylase [Methanoregulaceae archaeon]
MLGRIYLILALVFAGGIITGLLLSWEVDDDQDRETLFQISTMDVLLNGGFDGIASVSELERHGDFGIGTFHALNGEMIAIDGDYYQVRKDGEVVLVNGTVSSPFAMVTFFEPDISLPIGSSENITVFSEMLEKQLPDPGAFYAVRITGIFPYMKTRSVPSQEKPYPRLSEAVNQQAVFNLNGTKGTIAGIWSPDSSKGMSVPGIHLHYITTDMSAGGHILDFSVYNGTAEIDLTPTYLVVLPGESNPSSMGTGTAAELSLVEKGR